MTETENVFTVRRIVVAIDNNSQTSGALDVAASLASYLNSELSGLYVEDINLVRLAALPIGREICFPNGICRDFTDQQLDAEYREQSTSARHAIARSASRARVTYSFRVARGQVEAEVISAAGEADLLVLGTGDSPLRPRRRLGRTALAALEHAPRSILIAKPHAHPINKLLVCFDGTEGGKRALQAAVRISGARTGSLTVLIAAEDLDKAAALRQEVGEILAPLDVQPNFLHCSKPTPEQTSALASRSEANLLVVGSDSPMMAGDRRTALIEAVNCPVLLVR